MTRTEQFTSSEYLHIASDRLTLAFRRDRLTPGFFGIESGARRRAHTEKNLLRPGTGGVLPRSGRAAVPHSLVGGPYPAQDARCVRAGVHALRTASGVRNRKEPGLKNPRRLPSGYNCAADNRLFLLAAVEGHFGFELPTPTYTAPGS